MEEKTVSSKLIYNGKKLRLRVDQVEASFGKSEREIIEHPPAVTILPFDSADSIYLIHQYRKAIDQIIIEAPAGCIEPNEDPYDAAIRELKEETGFTSNKLIKVAEMFMAPGFCNEFMTLFLATDLTSGKTSFDFDESMELKSYSLKDLKQMIRSYEIKDAKTIASIGFLSNYLTDEL
ncbi:MAG: NUDIX hydrolase [Candidatus Marinamargulisbacteria bacterium]